MIDSTHLHNEINICKALLQTHETHDPLSKQEQKC